MVDRIYAGTGCWGELCGISKTGTRLSFAQLIVLDADFAPMLRTALGRDLGFDDLSRKESRIPRNVRKKMTKETVTIRSGTLFIK